MKHPWLLKSLIICGTLLSPFVVAKQIVLFGVFNTDFPPFHYVVDQQHRGLDADLIREAFSRLPEYEVQYKFLPVRRAILELEWGSLDMTTGFSSRMREKTAYIVKTPLHWSFNKVAVLKGMEFNFEGLEDLRGIDVAILNGSRLGQEFDQAVSKGKIQAHYVDSFEDTVKMLTSGRMPGIIGNYPIIDYYASKMGFSDAITYLPRLVVPPIRYSLLISRKSKLPGLKILHVKLEKALNDMLIDGTYDRIYRRHGLSFEHFKEDS